MSDRLIISANTDRTIRTATVSNFVKRLCQTDAVTVRRKHHAFLDEALSITKIKDCHNNFKEGRTSVEVTCYLNVAMKSYQQS